MVTTLGLALSDLDTERILSLLAALILATVPLVVLARGLGVRLPRTALLLAFLLPLVLLTPWLAADRVLAPTDILSRLPSLPKDERVEEPHRLLNDAVYQFLPWEKQVRAAYADGRLPLWSPLLDGGSSPWSNPQAGVLSPVFLVARVCARPEDHFLVALALKILVGFLGAFVLTRVVGVGRGAALTAGAGFGLGGGILSWAVFPHTAAAAWIPWVTAAAVRLIRCPPGRRRGAMAVAALSTAALLLGGHPETAAGGGLLAAGASLWFRRRRGWAHFLRHTLAPAALASSLGFLLAAPHLLPFLHQLPHSQRADRTLDRGPAQRLSFEWTEPESWFSLNQGPLMVTPFYPRLLGEPYVTHHRGHPPWPVSTNIYAGLVAVVGILLLLLLGRGRRRRGAFFLGSAFLILVLAAEFLPLLDLVHHLPPLRTLTFNRFLGSACLALAVAGALGFDAILRRRRRLAWRSLGGVLLVLAVAVELVPWGRALLPTGERRLFFPETRLIERLTEAYYNWSGSLSPDRVPNAGLRVVGESHSHYPYILSWYGFADIRHHDPMAERRYSQALAAAFEYHASKTDYFSSFQHGGHPFFDFLGVRFLLSDRSMPPPETLSRLDRRKFGPHRLYLNPGALPQWFFPTAAEVVPEAGWAEAVRAMQDARRVLLLSEEVGSWRPPNEAWRPLSVLKVEESPGRFRVVLPSVEPESTTAEERLLASSLPGPAGWQTDMPRVTVNGAFLGLRIPPGTRQVVAAYLPPGLIPGVLLAALGSAFLAACVPLRRE